MGRSRRESGRLLIIVVVLVALSSGVVYWRRVAGAPERHFREGLESYAGRGFSQAAASWEQAAALGHTEAGSRLGGLYLEGQGVSRNHKRAFELFDAAAREGLPSAQLELARLYDDGRGISPDMEQAVLWYWAAAKNDDVEAQFELGRMYEAGRGVEVDLVESATWYRHAAEAGFGEAQLALGLVHLKGRGVDESPEMAVRWLTRAAEDADLPDAWYQLGKLHEKGLGTKKDFRQAAWCYEQAIEDHHPAAFYRLGRLYESGRHGERDVPKAVSLYFQAAELGHAEAQYRLAQAFETGEGNAPRSQKKAKKWYRKAAEQGHVEAMAALQDLGLDRAELSRYQKRRLERKREEERKEERDREITKETRELQRPGMCELYKAGQSVTEMRTRVDCLNRGGTFKESEGGSQGSFVTVDTEQNWRGQRRDLARRRSQQERQARARDRYDSSDDYQPPSGDWIVCNTRGKRDSSGRGHYRCSSAIPKTSATTRSWCREQGYDGRRLFKHESSARSWRSDNCW